MITVTDLYAGAGGATTTYQPIRVQRRRSKGWRTPLCGCGCGEPARYVGRGSRWGNPVRVTRWRDAADGVWVYSVDLPTGETVGTWGPEFGFNPEAHAHRIAVEHYIASHIPTTELRPLCGHDLACWCPPGLPCHADVLLTIANREALSWDG